MEFKDKKHVIIFIISSLNAMFEASSVYFQCVNERAAHVKIDRDSRWCGPGLK